jgi:hypothetical protein
MELNQRFAVRFRYKCAGTEVEEVPITADQFFDSEVKSEYPYSEWDCDLPWEFCSAEEYIPTSCREGTLEFIDIVIIDNVSGEARRLVNQYCDDIYIGWQWNNHESAGAVRQIIIDVPNGTDGSRRYIKLLCGQWNGEVTSSYVRKGGEEFIILESISGPIRIEPLVPPPPPTTMA